MRRFALVVALGFVLGGCSNRAELPSRRADFDHVLIDHNGPKNPWGKGVGDLNGDGLPDLIVGGHAGGGLVWYENPSWEKHVIATAGSFSTDHKVADIDGDGRNDVVSLQQDRLVWYRNGDWSITVIDERLLHDIEVADLDGDGRNDVVARGQDAFAGVGDKLRLYLQRPGGVWTHRVVDCPKGEGLKLSDLDGDGRLDIVINAHWYGNPGSPDRDWTDHVYTHTWTWPHTYVAVHDLNGDNRPDIVLSPAELPGDVYRISWFEAPTDRAAEWVEHVVDSDVEAVHHFVAVADIDLDGRADIVTAKMHHGSAPQEIKIYFNLGAAKAWAKEVVATTGSHNMRLIDVDGDGDSDFFGANWDGAFQPVELWINRTCAPGALVPPWRLHVIDDRRPWRSAFVSSADLDGDGLMDIAAGGWWYRNPGRAEGGWPRNPFSEPANNVALLQDIDGDGDIDALASRWKGESPAPGFVWAENDGQGRFSIHSNIPDGAGDFLQGVASGAFTRTDRLQIALSWHLPGKGLQLLTVPERPATETWTWDRIADFSQDEALSAGDIDRDGRLDLLLGTEWLQNRPDGWLRRKIDATLNAPDRNRLADINHDGHLDAIVGFEAISTLGDVIWYEQLPDPEALWTPHTIGKATGPMSLDVADVDGDGDLDVVVGEHNLEAPVLARLLLFENVDGRGGKWQEHFIHIGNEHHDGALTVDLDGDGDLDVVSIGWGHDRVLWYEQLALRCNSVHR